MLHIEWFTFRVKYGLCYAFVAYLLICLSNTDLSFIYLFIYLYSAGFGNETGTREAKLVYLSSVCHETPSTLRNQLLLPNLEQVWRFGRCGSSVISGSTWRHMLHVWRCYPVRVKTVLHQGTAVLWPKWTAYPTSHTWQLWTGPHQPGQGTQHQQYRYNQIIW